MGVIAPIGRVWGWWPKPKWHNRKNDDSGINSSRRERANASGPASHNCHRILESSCSRRDVTPPAKRVPDIKMA